MNKSQLSAFFRSFLAGWKAFLRWRGWRVSAAACVKGWKAVRSWSGWGRLFLLPTALLFLLVLLSAGGLAYVFFKGLENTVPAYFLYALSAYALTAVLVQLPRMVRAGKRWLATHPRLSGYLHDQELKFTLGLHFDQFLNFCYGIFKIVTGVVIGSAWIGADGIYNLTQGLIQLFQILRRRKISGIRQQWDSYRLCGVLILLMHLTMTGLVFQMVNWSRAEEHPGYLIFATAAFVFYKIIHRFVDIAKDRKHVHPVDSSVRMLDLSQAIFSMFSLQVSMIHTFGTGEAWEGLMNLGTGCAACLLVAAIGVYMILRGSREIKQLQEKTNG